MQTDLKQILTQLSVDIDQDTLMNYLDGTLSPEKQHDLEKAILDNEFAADAIDGLQDFNDKKKLALVVEQLNADLKKRTGRKAARRSRSLQTEPWLLLSLAIILVLVIICYFILFRNMQTL